MGEGRLTNQSCQRSTGNLAGDHSGVAAVALFNDLQDVVALLWPLVFGLIQRIQGGRYM